MSILRKLAGLEDIKDPNLTNKQEKDESKNENNNHGMLSKKIFGFLSYFLMFVFIIVLIKTEIRKWFVFEGDPSSANSLLFWMSLGFVILFGYCGLKLLPKEKK